MHKDSIETGISSDEQSKRYQEIYISSYWILLINGKWETLNVNEANI